MTTAEMAARLVAAQISVIPVKLDGSKIPSLDSWKPYQERLATAAELREWFGGRYPKGLGIVTGRVSGNLESIDFDDLTLAEPWNELVEAECPGLTKRLVLIVTPRPGLQFWYRCEEAVAGNQKLAQRPMPGEVPPVKTLIETRGEGGYAVAPGSPLAVHANGTAYQVAGGDPAEPPTITAAEREILLRCARALNECAEPERTRPARTVPYDRPAGDLRPGDDFNAREDFEAYLERQGWHVAKRTGEVAYLRRPGKVQSWSASLGKVAPGVLHVFTTNAHPLEDGGNYDLFRAYAAFEHHGDLKAAARELGARGYGAPPVSRDKPPLPDEPPPDRWQTESAGYEQQRQERFAEKAEREAPKNGQHPPPMPAIYTAQELETAEFKEPKWIIPGILCEGLCLLVGPPKGAKSALALGTAIATASGGYALAKFPVEQGEVLYLALEDIQRRMQDRMRKMLKGARAPKDLHFSHRWPKAGEQGGDMILARWIEQHERTRLVIIDTMEKFRDRRKTQGSVYGDDYSFMERLQKVAIDYGICLLMLHHTNKRVDPADPFHAVSGSEGVSGGADTTLLLRRSRGERHGKLFVTSRDVEENEYDIEFDGETMTWLYRGKAGEGPKTLEQAEVLKVVATFRVPVTPKDVHFKMSELGSRRTQSSVKTMMWRLFQDGELTLHDKGAYGLPSKH